MFDLETLILHVYPFSSSIEGIAECAAHLGRIGFAKVYTTPRLVLICLLLRPPNDDPGPASTLPTRNIRTRKLSCLRRLERKMEVDAAFLSGLRRYFRQSGGWVRVTPSILIHSHRRLTSITGCLAISRNLLGIFRFWAHGLMVL